MSDQPEGAASPTLLEGGAPPSTGDGPAPSPPRTAPWHPALRFGAWLGSLVGGAWLGARILLHLLPPTRAGWMLVGVGVNTDVLVARLTTSNTGFYDGQLTTRLVLLRQSGQVVDHRASYGPTEATDRGVASGPDGLVRRDASMPGPGKDGWSLRIGGDGVQASGFLDGATQGCPPEPGTFTGTLGTSPAGTAGSFDGGDIVRATAVVVPTRAEGRVDEAALYILGNGAALGVDPRSPCPAWARIGLEAWSGPAPEIPPREVGRVQLGPWEVTWRGTSAAHLAEAHGHVAAWERALAVVVGWPEPTLRAVRVGAQIRGPGFDEPRTGVLLVRGTRLQ